MRSDPVDFYFRASSFPGCTPEHRFACAEKIGRYLDAVTNAEGLDGLGDRVAHRFPNRADAVATLGHVTAQQFDPDAVMPAIDDVDDDPVDADGLYELLGCCVLSRAPDIDRPAGIFAAAGVVCALAAQMKLEQQAALSPQPVEADAGRIEPDATRAALAFLQQAIDLQDLLDHRDDAAACDVPGDVPELDITRL